MNKGTPADPLREALVELVAADDALKAAQQKWCREHPVYAFGDPRASFSSTQTVTIPDPDMDAAANRLGVAWINARAALATKPAETPAGGEFYQTQDKLKTGVTGHPTESAGKSPTLPSVQPPAPEPQKSLGQCEGMTTSFRPPERCRRLTYYTTDGRYLCPSHGGTTPSIAQRGAALESCADFVFSKTHRQFPQYWCQRCGVHFSGHKRD